MKLIIPAGCLVTVMILLSCSDIRRNPGRIYMPDMAYSQAYETNSSVENLEKKGIQFTGMPVEGTVALDDNYLYPLKNTPEDYIKSAGIRNPLSAENLDIKEAKRLYLIYCGICHGANLDGNGPLFNAGSGPFSAAPKNFNDSAMKAMPEGTMFHSVTYGKGQMGSHASQLSAERRWMIVGFIKAFQGGGTPPASRATADSLKNK